MKRRLARTLYLLSIATLGLSGCAKNDTAKTVDEQPVQKAAQSTDSPSTTTTEPEPTVIVQAGVVNEAADSSALEKKSSVARAHKPKSPMRVRRDRKSVRSSAAGMAAPAKIAGKRAYPRTVAPPPPPNQDPPAGNTESYKDYGKNPMVDTAKDNLSTFAVDVDTASYAIARSKILSGQAPPAAAVRVEEFVNYFKYNYAGPTDGAPFAVHMDAAPSPFNSKRHILRVGVQAKKLSLRERKPANLVFLVDVSGSMSSPSKLPLAKRALRVLVDSLKDGDTVSLVTYAGATKVVLEPTGLDKKAEIFSALEQLHSGGGTAMGSGMQLAYAQAAKNLRPGTISRVIVLSDGDANIGRTSHDAMLKTIAGKVKEGVTMTTVGLGMGNYKDTMMEQLANKGNGNYYYIDGMNEARKIFQEQLGGTLQVVAKDVKIQVDFNKETVKSYRLVGYENRDVADRDFRNDKVDAGEIGAGHTVTAIYEVELTGTGSNLATVRLRAKKPRGSKATETAYSMTRDQVHASFEAASTDFQFATAVMATAEILRRSEHAQSWSIAKITAIAKAAATADNHERQEFIALLKKVLPIQKQLAIAR